MNITDRADITASRILDLWDQGKGTFEIASELGCHESVVANYLARLTGETEPAPQWIRRSA